MNEHEEWRPVVGYEGLYEVSNLGRVRGVDRFVYSPRSGTGARQVTGKIRRVEMGSTGYLQTSLCGKTKRIHRLVADAFLGPRPEGMQTCHNDGDKTNNRADNLRYGTQGENQLDSVLHGTHVNARKTHCPQGHPYDETNTLRSGRDRRCATCHYARMREYDRKRRATA